MSYIALYKTSGGKYAYFRLMDNKGRFVRHLGKSNGGFEASLRTKAKLIEALDKYPDLAGRNNVQVILAEYKRRTVRVPESPNQVYKTIVIDPPWPMEKIRRKERPNQVDFDYSVMSIEEIKAFQLPSDPEGCHVYLWTTQKYLPSAIEVFEVWGVKYQCVLTWVKNVGFTPFSWMYSTEHCLFGRIGDLPLLVLGKRLDFAAKVREHSRKPNEFYELVRQVSPEPRVDIFSREPRFGFDQYGNETGKFKR